MKQFALHSPEWSIKISKSHWQILQSPGGILPRFRKIMRALPSNPETYPSSHLEIIHDVESEMVRLRFSVWAVKTILGLRAKSDVEQQFKQQVSTIRNSRGFTFMATAITDKEKESQWLKNHHRVHLRYTSSYFSLIVRKKTGVIYRNQVGGWVMYQADAEGYVIPLRYNETDLKNIVGQKYSNKFFRHVIELLQKQFAVTICQIHFDKKNARVVWLPLKCLIDGKRCRCILTWVNCD